MTLRTVLLTLITLAMRCGADGGYFFQELQSGSTAASADQRAVLVYLDERETLLLQTRYEGEPGDFAWVIPTPTRVGRQDVVEGAEEVFEELARSTAPRGYVWESGGGGCMVAGCAGSEGGGGTREAVSLWDQFSVGGYEVSVLSADDSAELARWLGDNGYEVPSAAEPVIHRYTEKDWFFVALKVREAAAGGTAPPEPGAPRRRMGPVRITFATEAPVFPMHISAVSTREQVGVHLYVIAPHRVRSTNYTTGQVEASRPFNSRTESFEDYYESQLRGTVSALGPRSLAVEYAGALSAEQLGRVAEPLGLNVSGSYYLTRLSTFIRPEHMTEDIQMVSAVTDAPFRFEAGASPTAVAAAKTAFCGLWLLGVVLHGRAARRRTTRAALLLATVLVALAV